ncbi:MAG: metal ABC transporter permease [marine benthic group bacterium]|jgi:zinc transport system permease protein|nr:metal ABC transporter permease [Gemmatimonadota bacterium]MCL7963506.1 metal ABC transporter permease [Candidatus Carthagonibacter metallireducens]MCL7957053.1 metal ABC transporter permease [Gemmatimonadota bacterium]MCL7966458.1 metal ABC transporter permease [Gemmatimonadota bacterium]MCL7969291.1 metal ABC transporter permease [Gemmatimonadota bacterium]
MIGEALSYPFFQRALVAGLLASVACGVVGSLVVVRRIASISGGLSHAAFGGVGLGFLAGFDPLLGALGFGVASALGIGVAELRLRQGLDTLIAMIWAVGMAMGIIFVSLAPGEPPDLLGYLFGNILLVNPQYILLVLVLDLLIVGVVATLFRKLRAISFDGEFAWVIGVPVGPLFLLLLTLVALTVVILIRVVGVILVIALLTIPAAIARHWTDHLSRMMLMATAIGATSIALGLFLTFGLSMGPGIDLPTGPAIILLTAILFGLSAAGRYVIARGRSPGGVD